MSKLYRLLTIGICTVLLIVACGRSPNSLKSDPATSASSESCRLVSHEMGETKVCGQPQKVAALSPHILDSILALGVQPSAYAEIKDLKLKTYDNPTEQIPYLGKWVKTQPVALGHELSPSLERLTLLQPDLILGEYWQEDKYPLLTQIAPTLLFRDNYQPNQLRSWQQDIEGIARALGREAQAQELLMEFDQQIAQAQTELQPVLEAYPRIFLISSDLTTNVYSVHESTAARLLQKIGFKIIQPPDIQGNSEISWEILPRVKTDLIIVLSYSSDRFYNSEDTTQKKWAKNPLLNSMPVFQQGRVFFVDSYLWISHTRGPLTDNLILKALPDLLLDSVKKAERAKNSA